MSLAEVVRNLPHYIEPGTEVSYSEAIDNAAPAERDAVVPGLIGWLKDERPRVRGMALLSLSFLYMPTASSRVFTCSRYLPVEDIPIVAAYLKDADSRVRNATFLALSSVENCGHGLDELVDLVLPMLREPDILTEYPDPFFVESNERMLANMTPQQQAAFQAQHRPVIKLPAEGPLLLSILAVPTLKPSPAVDDAMVGFLDRPDQTKSTLGESLHTLALSRASERVNDEALRRVFEQKAMTVFLLQFIAQLLVDAGAVLGAETAFDCALEGRVGASSIAQGGYDRGSLLERGPHRPMPAHQRGVQRGLKHAGALRAAMVHPFDPSLLRNSVWLSCRG